MKITVIGASGLIGRILVDMLGEARHEVVAASRSSGVDAMTGAGLADALRGSDTLVDVTNSPSFEADAVMAFFTTSAANLADAALSAGVRHYVALSIVGVDGLPDSPYFRAKVAQERVITESGIPFTIVRATQFAEFTDAIVDSMTVGDEVRVPDALIQPIPADDVAAALAGAAAATPRNEIVNIGGPKRVTFEEMASAALRRRGDAATRIVVDPDARYFGAPLTRESLIVQD
jgi:uncharacterized protein YbjT (DUF2867 family)